MFKQNLFSVLIFLIAAGLMSAQTENKTEKVFSFSKNDPTSTINFTGNLSIDNQLTFNEVPNEISSRKLNKEIDSKKSPWLGALFSVIIPGAGEVYAGSYWKAGIFVAIEAAVITTAVIYNKKGNDQTDTFEKFADNVTDNTGWSAVRYAEWLNQYYDGNITIDYVNTSKPPWERVNFAEIHAVEEKNSVLSHQLAPYGEQQYYEMIGKYHQFRAGWADYTGGIAFDVSPMFHQYTGMRAKANNYYSVASTAVIGIYLNHFLSAIDAYWSTTIYNKELLVNMTVENKQYVDIIELVPTISLKFSF
jgi:hypothetical protein